MQRRSFTRWLAALAWAPLPRLGRTTGTAAGSAASGGTALGLNADLQGLRLFTASQWARDVSTLPVHPRSANYLKTLGTQRYSQDAGGWLYAGKTVGIPYYVVDSRSQPMVPVVCGRYLSESDLVYAPLPLQDDIIEGYPGNAAFPAPPDETSDRHVVVVDRQQRVSYELFQAYRRGDHWYCAAMSVWDLDGDETQRPFDDTSADVAGLPILAGLMLGHQVLQDRIDHAFRFTIQHQCPHYLSPPASHASTFGNRDALPFGGRLRLKASVSEVSKPGGGAWHVRALRIIRALKQYGMINADTGLALSPQGDTSPWDRTDDGPGPAWQDLRLLNTDDFEVVDTGATQYTYGAAGHSGAPPAATLASSVGQVHVGGAVTLMADWSGAASARLTPVGHALRAPQHVIDRPARDAWYQLEAANPHGRVRRVVRVVMRNGPRRYDRYDRYIGPLGLLSNDGLTPATAWPITVVASREYRHLVAGFVIGVLDGSYDLAALSSADYDHPLLELPSGVFGKPTVLQALNPRRALISGGASARAMLGSRYQHLSQIQLIGLHFRTDAAAHALYFSGDGAFLIDDCEFSGFKVAAIRANGVAAPLIRGNAAHNTGTSWLMLLSDCEDVLMSDNTLDVPERHWGDWSGNRSIVVD